MSTKIKGTKFIYDIDDTDYLDGFIAKGTESFVFKAKKYPLMMLENLIYRFPVF